MTTESLSIAVPAPYMGMIDATLDVKSIPHPLDHERDYARMTLTVAGEVIAQGEPFGAPGGRDWTSVPAGEVAQTFGAFLGHALESSEDDARDGWTVLDEDRAPEWAEALWLMGEEA